MFFSDSKQLKVYVEISGMLCFGMLVVIRLFRVRLRRDAECAIRMGKVRVSGVSRRMECVL